MHVFDANAHIIRDLRDGPSGRQTRTCRACCCARDLHHPYPHCWRCGNPLIQRAVDSWFVKVTAFRDRMVELNQQITWVPEKRQGRPVRQVAGGRAGLETSPATYWAARSGVGVRTTRTTRQDVYGSLDSWSGTSGYGPTDLHRPHNDELTRPNPTDPTGRFHMRRVPEVLDCWFDRFDAVRPGALPVREPRVVRVPTTRATSSSVQRAEPAAVLHAARAGHAARVAPRTLDVFASRRTMPCCDDD